MLKNAAIYLSANVANLAVPFLLIPVLTQHLTPEEYGTLAMFQLATTAFVTLIGLEGIGAVTRKYFDRHKDGGAYKDFSGAAFQIFLVCCFCFVVVSILFGAKISALFFLPVQYFWVALSVAAGGVMISLRLNTWQASNKATKFGLFQVSQSLINFFITLILIVIFNYGFDGRILAIVISTIFCAGAATFSLYKDGMLPFLRWRPLYIKQILAYGLPLLPHSIGIFLLSSVDRYVINSELGASATGVYMLALQISLAFNLLFNSLNNAFSPWLFERLNTADSRLHRKLVKGTYVYFFVLMLLASFGFLLGPWAVTTFISSRYAEAAGVIGFVILGQCFLAAQFSVINYLIYAKATKYISVSSVATGLLYVWILYILIDSLGLVGAGLAFSVSMGLRFLLLWFFAYRIFPLPWFSVVELRGPL